MGVVIRRLAVWALVLCAQVAQAGPWLVGQQPITYSSAHTLGDGSNARGGEAPFYSSGEPDDIATPSALATTWTIVCTNTPITSNGVTYSSSCGSGGTWTGGQFSDAAGDNGWPAGDEAKARFDCNITFHEPNDPILAPGVANGSTHDHSFFGALGYQGHAQDITYAGLRSGGGGGAQAGYSTCYGGPMNRTLYWEPTMMVPVNGIVADLKPFTIITYYICGDAMVPPANQYGPANCSRWPRSLDMVFGFNMSDPTGTSSAQYAAVQAANTAGGNYTYSPAKASWYCAAPATPSYTAYAPNQTQGAHQPYLNDANGHETLNCLVTDMAEATGCTLGTPNCGYVVVADNVSSECWDGKNPTSPNGRGHLIDRIHDNNTGGNVCPDGWYLVPHFEVKAEFLFKSLAEIRSAYLSCDRMTGMTQFKGGECFHADLLPAWDYGTGDKPGFMLKFFQHCLGLSMHVKNSDGTTYTDLTGDPHECGYGRISADTQAVVNDAPPDGLGPNPVVNLAPDQTGALRYFPLAAGTALPSTVLHQKH